jgi:hypothetical protein
MDGKENVTIDDLLRFFGARVDKKDLEHRVEAVIRTIGADGQAMTRDQAFEVLDKLSAVSGTIGVVARFAKVRAILELG